ncbi:predicted protein [Scheffersomyces stipitis CBS 6054]|uniref:DNA-binding TFAR19-related protein n=1 Tax=Scheffersomyces stipitis (strain ATCC 58785 / CBS 6054 / NBRC 10063 / NRRL Y-11545) TaxID=322104 RepID=A3LXT7_PICST|nr:predicted protein [Scheffersomyces stipitis CBS 6054]ABN67521.1 predicted protein [Scheffersomyces stipitis CBS 6054]KAG2732145.1 hypothetical protein G9P44_004562 [Scheffersomyces stipitis]
MDDSELNAIRAARLAELQKQTGGSSDSGQSSPQDEARASALSRVLEPSARERLSRVRMVRPERAQQVEQYILRLFQTGSINRKLSEKDIVEILDGISRDSNKQASTKIIYDRKQNTIDDEEEEEEEDDFFD